ADVIRLGQADGTLTRTTSADDAGLILVASFDGVKTTSDMLARGDVEGFQRRARSLLKMLTTALRA
ncbi:MAG: hypothetical protein JWP75_2796, partial [Frondihabitans sp.]|nr:hypothetical protein [Frondihabitans sp.]